jgi:branched-subunit amino acid transport protein
VEIHNQRLLHLHLNLNQRLLPLHLNQRLLLPHLDNVLKNVPVEFSALTANYVPMVVDVRRPTVVHFSVALKIKKIQYNQ